MKLIGLVGPARVLLLSGHTRQLVSVKRADNGVAGSNEVFDVRGERGLAEQAFAGSEARKIRPQDADAVRG